MKVKELMIEAAKTLGVMDFLQAYWDGRVSVSKCEDALLGGYNRVENELALDYLPLVAEEEKVLQNGIAEYAGFSNSVVRILSVEDERGNALPFRLYAKYLKTQPGKVRITYTYEPKIKGLEDECEFTLFVSNRLFVYGMLHQYCVTYGAYEEAELWDKKYRECLACSLRDIAGKRIKGRIWV